MFLVTPAHRSVVQLEKVCNLTLTIRSDAPPGQSVGCGPHIRRRCSRELAREVKG